MIGKIHNFPFICPLATHTVTIIYGRELMTFHNYLDIHLCVARIRRNIILMKMIIKRFLCWLVVTENCGTDLGLEVWRICPPMDLWIIKCLRWWWSYMKYAQSNGYKFALLNKSLSSSTDSWLFSFSAKKIMFNSWGLTLKMSFAVLSILSTYCLSC